MTRLIKGLISLLLLTGLVACQSTEPKYAGISGTGSEVPTEVVAGEIFIERYPFAQGDAPKVQNTFAAANSLGSNIIKGEVAYVSQTQGLIRLSGETTNVVLTRETLLVDPEGRVLSPQEFFRLMKQGTTVFIEASLR